MGIIQFNLNIKGFKIISDTVKFATKWATEMADKFLKLGYKFCKTVWDYVKQITNYVVEKIKSLWNKATQKAQSAKEYFKSTQMGQFAKNTLEGASAQQKAWIVDRS